MLKHVEKIRAADLKTGPTADRTSNIVMKRAKQVRVGVNNSHLAGIKSNVQKINKTDAGVKVGYSSIFPRMRM